MYRFIFILLVVISGLGTNSHLPVKGYNQIKQVINALEETSISDIEFLNFLLNVEDTLLTRDGGCFLKLDNVYWAKEFFVSYISNSQSNIVRRLLFCFLIDIPPPTL